MTSTTIPGLPARTPGPGGAGRRGTAPTRVADQGRSAPEGLAPEGLAADGSAADGSAADGSAADEVAADASAVATRCAATGALRALGVGCSSGALKVGTGWSSGALKAAGVVGQSTRALCSPVGVVGAALETAWVSTHLALYPFGLLARAEEATGHRYSIAQLPPAQRGLVIGDVEAAGTPILLVHGMVDNRSIFTLLRRGLRRRGFGRVLTLNYSPLTADVRTAAALLAQEVEELVAESGYERVHVVGHSLGGLIARYYVTRLGGDERVHTLVTLGTPHNGTYSAYALPSRLCRQLRPGSALMRELAQPVPGCRTRFVAYWSDLDQMVLPQRHARLEHPDLAASNIEVRGLGHMSLPISGRVVHGISTTLAHLDTDGSTLTAGVTEIAGPPARRRPSS